MRANGPNHLKWKSPPLPRRPHRILMDAERGGGVEILIHRKLVGQRQCLCVRSEVKTLIMSTQRRRHFFILSVFCSVEAFLWNRQSQCVCVCCK